MSTDIKVKDFDAKMKSARADVPDIASLRKLQRVPSLTFFRIGGDLFAWLPFDSTPDDGASSISREDAPARTLGRYRRASPLE